MQVGRELNASQGRAREALRDFELRGIVEVQAGKGTRVRRLSERDLKETSQVRAIIEQFAAELAGPH